MLIRKKSVFPLRSDQVSIYDRMRDMREFRGGREGGREGKLNSSRTDKCTKGREEKNGL